MIIVPTLGKVNLALGFVGRYSALRGSREAPGTRGADSFQKRRVKPQSVPETNPQARSWALYVFGVGRGIMQIRK